MSLHTDKKRAYLYLSAAHVSVLIMLSSQRMCATSRAVGRDSAVATTSISTSVCMSNIKAFPGFLPLFSCLVLG